MSDGILARAFAQAGDHDQAEILNLMARELYVACKSKQAMDTQCCYISAKLKDAIPMIEILAEYIKLRKDEMK
jgi:hypothetical protein